MTAITTTQKNGWLLAPTSFGELMQFADIIAKSDLVPKDYRNKPGNCIVAIQLGAAVGLSPLQALQGIAVVCGKPSMYGDALLAVAIAHESVVDVIETSNAEGATCTVKRRGRADVTRTFTWADAEKAHLLKKQGPWTEYPKRMLQMRARGFALRDACADILMGIASAEEQTDIVEQTATAVAVVEKAPSAAQRVESVALPATTDVVKFKWSDMTWNGKPVYSAPADVIVTYIDNLTAVLNDESRKRLHKWAFDHRTEVEKILENLVRAETELTAPPHSDIGDKLQAVIDSQLADPSDSNHAADGGDWVTGEVTT